MIDVKDIKVGDEIIIKGAVADIKDTIRVDFGGILFWVRPEHIVEHTPKPHEWHLGDIVSTRWGAKEVLGIWNKELWVSDGQSTAVLFAGDCTFVRRKSA